jgi:hypothetical protein
VSNPWDPFPSPRRGDDSAAQTFEWAGRVISQWVHIEFQLGLLYSVLAGRPNHAATVREYGAAGKIFRERLRHLRRTANHFFVANCHQELEAEFHQICLASEGFADRRNEVAHAVVFPSVFLPSFVEDRRQARLERWALAPPYFEGRQFNTEDFPAYAYTSRELNELVIRLIALQKRIESFSVALRVI